MLNRLRYAACVAALALAAPRATFAQDANDKTPSDTPAAASSEPKPHDPKAEAKVLIGELEDKDPKVRRVAAVRLKNLAGPALEVVEEASKREDLGEEAKAVVVQAVPMIRYRASRDKLSADIDAYDIRSSLEGYEKAGRKNPKWDALVKEALARRSGSNPRADDAAVLARFKKAVDAGCDDPFVLYLYARRQWVAGVGDRDEVLERHREAAYALAGTNYPAEWKSRAAARYLEQTGANIPELGKIALDFYPAAVAEMKRPYEDVFGYVELVFNALAPAHDRQELFEQLHEAYLKSRPADDSGPYVFKGKRYKDYAWEARGSGFAHTVREEGWELFGERLAAARKALEKAYAIDPDDARGPTEMITVVMGESGDRRELEKWFGRAMKANPDNRAAAWRKLYFLYPRWHGSGPEMVAFGRQCLDTQNWWGPLPTILIDAHEEAARWNDRMDAKQYYAQPEVWADIEGVYGSFLEAFPDSPRARWYRSKLAKWACDCAQWDAARKQFAQMGEDFDPSVFRSKAVYNYYRKKADRMAKGVLQASADAAPLEQ